MGADDDRWSAGVAPSADARADYDYVAGEVHRPDLVDALDDRIDGDVRFDSYTRELYATDTSPYEQTSVGILRRAGFIVDALDSGCCGIAGAFGYAAEHYSMSQAIG